MAGPRRGKRETSDIKGARILLVEARYYDDIADLLLAGAMKELEGAGADVERISVPGSLEIPIAIALALDAATKKCRPYEGVVALGCVIRGDTVHFEIVSNEFGARPDGPRYYPQRADRQRHNNRQYGSAGIRPRANGRAGQGRRRCPRGARACAPRPAFAETVSACPLDPKPEPKDKRKANKRGAARLAAVQALYQMDLAGTGLNEILAEFENHWLGAEVEGANYLPAEAAFFCDIVGGVVREQTKLDPRIDAALSRAGLSSASKPVLRAVLRAGAYELTCRRDIPARVVTSEYVDVASAFVEEDGTGMVNAVLDQLARELRTDEFDGAARYRVRSSVGRFCQRLGAPQEEGSDLLGLFVSNRCDHGPFDTHHQPVGPQQSRPALAGEFAPQNAAVPRIRRTDHKVFALEIGVDLHRLRRHESGARQTRIRNAGVQFDRRENGILRSCQSEADAASHPCGRGARVARV